MCQISTTNDYFVTLNLVLQNSKNIVPGYNGDGT